MYKSPHKALNENNNAFQVKRKFGKNSINNSSLKNECTLFERRQIGKQQDLRRSKLFKTEINAKLPMINCFIDFSKIKQKDECKHFFNKTDFYYI
jgi:hypothetical protein